MAAKARGKPTTSSSSSLSSAAAKKALKDRWRPMVIESTEGLSSADFAGLVGLEELNPADFAGDLKIIRGGRKRGGSSSFAEEEEEEALSKKKKKKKKQAKKKVSSSVSEATTVDLNDGDDDDDNNDNVLDGETAAEASTDPSWSVKSMAVDDKKDEPVPSDDDDDDDKPKTIINSTASMFEWASLGVPEHILDRLQALGLTSPTPIQVATIPGALANGKFDEGDDLRKDIYGAAPTGSGKTLAFAIPMVAQIVAEKEKKLPENFSSSNSSTSTSRLRGLILTPTRELAVQIKKHIEAITIGGSGSSNRDLVRTALVVGGLAIQKQERILSHHQPDIVVATPGRLWEIISSGSVPYLDRKSIQAVQYLVVDEADRMVERGHFEELKQVIGLLNEQQQQQPSVSRRQTFIFSATLTLQKKKSKKLKHRKKADSETPNLIDLLRLDQSRLLVVDLTEGGLRSTPSADRLQEEIIHCLKEEKDVYLYYFLLEQQQQNSDPKSQNHKTIVFANSIDCLRRLLNLLRFLGLAPLVVHSSMPQKRRLTAIERFTTNASSSSSSSSGQVLLATDVAARGLDIPAVSAVVHYQCPRSAEIYIHRSGRTARGQRASGRSLILCDPQEEAFFLRDFCRILGKNANGKTDLAEYPINSKALRRCKERVRLATACDVLEHGLRKERSEVSWFKEAARAAEMDDSEEEDKDDEEEFDAAVDHGGKSKGNSLVNQRKLKAYQRQLSGLLKCSILFPK